jgi:hypothetical protein
MRQVAIYAISLQGSPSEVFYVGSSLDPAKRLADHRRGIDSDAVKPWFKENADNLLCYVIEWVSEDMRLPAESYWYLRLGGAKLLNSAWHEAYRHVVGYTTTATFDPSAAKGFTPGDGCRWHTVQPRVFAPPSVSDWAIHPREYRVIALMYRRMEEAKQRRSSLLRDGIPTEGVDGEVYMYEVGIEWTMKQYSISQSQLAALIAQKAG